MHQTWDASADLCFEALTLPLTDDSQVIALDHEDGHRTPLGTFSALLLGWIGCIERLLEWQKRFK